jgi:hypothetical protein
VLAHASSQFAWASRTDQPVCSLLLRLFHTGQTAVASIPRLSLSGLCEMLGSPTLGVFALDRDDLLGDLPVSSLVSSDQGPARPASHQRLYGMSRTCQTSAFTKSRDLFYHHRQKTEMENSAMDASRRYRLLAVLRNGYNTCNSKPRFQTNVQAPDRSRGSTSDLRPLPMGKITRPCSLLTASRGQETR